MLFRSVNYFFMLAEEVREIMAELGFRSFNDMIGRTEFLNTRDAISHWKAKGIDLSSILIKAPIIYEGTEVYCTKSQDHGLDKALDNDLIAAAEPAITRGEPVLIERPIININRVVGTMLSHEVTLATQGQGLGDDTIHVRLNGSAGQSLGAWLEIGRAHV